MKFLFKLSLAALLASFVALILVAQPIPGGNPNFVPGKVVVQPLGNGSGTNIFNFNNTYNYILTNTDWTLNSSNWFVPTISPFTNNVVYKTNILNGIIYILQDVGGTNQFIVKMADNSGFIEIVSNNVVTVALNLDGTTLFGNILYTWPASNIGGVLTNNGTGTLSWVPIETFITNTAFTTFSTTTIKVSGNAQFNQIIITNGFFAQTNLWAAGAGSSATNNVDASIYDQEFSTVTPIQFSGLINTSNSLSSEIKMTIKNASSSNITATAAAGFVFANGDTSETITNGHRGIFWINYDPALGGATNVVFQHF